MGRTPRSEMECQHEGGTCEFFVMCWMTGGLLQGTCNGMLQGCCHRTAKSSNLGAEAGKTFDLTDLPSTDYGPVINDNSECTDILRLIIIIPSPTISSSYSVVN